MTWRVWAESIQQWRLEMGARSVWEGDILERIWTVTNVRGKTEKDLKIAPISAKHAFFATEVSCQVKPPKHSKIEFLKKFSKCFLRMEGLPARESWKSLSNPRDWTFHSQTSHQNWPANSRLRPATWLTRDWVAKTGQKRIYEIFIFLEQNTFQKHLKHSKIFLCLN